ncbi:MAG: hypothetical protein H6978_10740 [Gammaproteobacteria bacterium]|nr:hypothetical protein [Gammaproteobacteria bacterium]
MKTMVQQSETSLKASPAWRQFMRRAGVAGFCFFLAKGLLWLAAPYIVYWWMH